MAKDNDELKVVDIHTPDFATLKLREVDIVFAFLEKIDLLNEDLITMVSSAMEKAGARRGAIVLPFNTRLYKHQEILEKAAADAVFGIVPTKNEHDARSSAEDIVRSRFTANNLDNLGTSWTEDLKEFKQRLPAAKGFGTDPALYDYFR